MGPYTAAAISSFAFNLPHAVVDGNVFRVLARVFGIAKPVDSTEGKKYFTALADELLDKKQPGLIQPGHHGFWRRGLQTCISRCAQMCFQ